MIRSDEQVRLDDCVVACGRAREGLEDAAGILREEDPILSDLLAEMALDRGSMATELGEQLKALDDLPSEPDADRSAVRKIARHVKAAFAREDRLTLLREREKDEDDLMRCLTLALETQLPPAARDVVDRLRGRVQRGLRTLADARVRVDEAPHAAPAAVR